ncbi:hypothetical protein Scep_025648 [Stephania cephalantha]|uniref:Uncharacterized protein n=1 Tax=Stephania cephalantha TaxID=152367 RepID=A0AAP0ESJ2_9MAGN
MIGEMFGGLIGVAKNTYERTDLTKVFLKVKGDAHNFYPVINSIPCWGQTTTIRVNRLEMVTKPEMLIGDGEVEHWLSEVGRNRVETPDTRAPDNAATGPPYTHVSDNENTREMECQSTNPTIGAYLQMSFGAVFMGDQWQENDHSTNILRSQGRGKDIVVDVTPLLAETTWEQGEPSGGVGLWALGKTNAKRVEAQTNRAQVFTGNTQKPNYMISSWDDGFVADLLAIASKYDISPAQLKKSSISNPGIEVNTSGQAYQRLDEETNPVHDEGDNRCETTLRAGNQTNSDFLDELDVVAQGYDGPTVNIQEGSWLIGVEDSLIPIEEHPTQGNDGLLRREETEGQSDNGVETVIIDEYNGDPERCRGSTRSSEIEETESDWGDAQNLDMDVEEWNGGRIADTFDHDITNPRDQNI